MLYKYEVDIIPFIWLAALIVIVLFLFLSREQYYRPLRPAALAVASFVFGLTIGVDLARRGFFVIPLSVMQQQMHEVWEIPLRQLRPPGTSPDP
jgi:hypothetical protein